jgi:predicted nucleotidyltransferase
MSAVSVQGRDTEVQHEAICIAEERRARALGAVDACARLLKERFGVQRVIPFGSLVGQGPWHARSDIDVAEETAPRP